MINITLQRYGLGVGWDASFVLRQSLDPIRAIRLRANRLKVWKRGQLLAETAEIMAVLKVGGRSKRVIFSLWNGSPIEGLGAV